MFTKITKILAAATIAAAGATTISAIHDKKAFDAIEDIAPIGEIGDVVPETAANAADEVLNSAEV